MNKSDRQPPEYQEAEVYTHAIPYQRANFSQQDRAIRHTTRQERFQCMSLTFADKGIGGARDDLLEGQEEDQGDRQAAKLYPGGPGDQRIHDASYGEKNQCGQVSRESSLR